jgi:cobalt-zinc-cadmium efflux system protein
MGGHHHHVDPNAVDRRIAGAVGVNLALTVVQIIGGILSGSLALIADAIHNLSDALALIIAFGARKIARRPADKSMTFGYARAEVVAALINYTTLVVVGLWLVYEGIARLITPEGVNGWLVIWIAAFALIIDVITAALTYALSKDSMNIRAAFLHNVSDALGSVGVIVAGMLILTFGWTWVDPVVTLGIAAYILWQSLSEIGPVIRLVMLGSPPEADAEAIVAEIRAVSIRLDQAVFSVHIRSALTSAFAISMSLRMTTTMATFAGFPTVRRASYLALSSGLNRIATSAGMYRASRRGLRPPPMNDFPCH